MASGQKASFLLVEEYFASGDGRFLDALRQSGESKKLAPFADRWKKDFRPWAREQIFQYLDLPLDRPGHQPVVKRLFKHAEEHNDDELMATFLVAFDRLVRRVRRKKYRYDWQTRRSWEEEYLYAPRNSMPGGAAERVGQNPKTLEVIRFTPYAHRKGILFSYHTRYHLRRRAWRYFRRMGHRRPGDFAGAVGRALAKYRDADLAKGENILDSWGLVHACFGTHDAIEFTASQAGLKPGRGLGELSPAPYFPELWKRREAAPVLLWLVTTAGSRLVRVWAMQLLRRDHKQHLAGLPAESLLQLLDHADEEVQQFGAELLEGAAELEKLPIPTWLRLLQTRNLTALETITQLMLRHVAGSRLTLQQCVDLAAARPVPVARAGLRFLRDRRIATAQDRATVAELAKAKSGGVGRELAAWALNILGEPGAYEVDLVVRFFDSLLKEVREGAWDWLASAGSAGHDDPALWSRLLETPYEDVRLKLVEALHRHAKLPGAGPDDLRPIWTAVLLGVHRGGRHKLSALRQISDAVRGRPQRAETLLPVLAVAIRSVRKPEARAGLAAVVAAVEASPELGEAVARHLPELDLAPVAATATAG